MPFRTHLLRAAAVATAGLLGVGAVATPAAAQETAVLDVMKLVDGELVVETVRVPAPTAESTAEALEERADVVVAGPQVTYEPTAVGPDPYWDTTDPQAHSRVRDVWSRTRGEGQVVAVLDTAASFEHADLFGQALPGTDLVGGAGSPYHGTGVAGIVAARADNGIGSAGMAPAAKVLPVRVCNDAQGCPSSAIARGILWATDRGADVINMSLSGPGYSDVTAAAIQHALGRGVAVVASSGNDGLNGNPVMYPAANSGVIAVSATAPTGAPADWAVHGWQVDIATVGDSVTLTMPGDGYGSGSGTSFSGPAVAGAVALLRSSHPGISTTEVQAALQAGSNSGGTWSRAYGAGRLDLPGAVAAADRADGGVTVTPSSGALDVSWAPVPGATTYTVRVDGVVRAQVAGTTTRVTGLTDGNQVAVDVQADDGPRSAPVLATVVASTPAVPTLHSAALRDTSTSTSAVVDLTASINGPAAPRYSIIRDGISIGTITWSMSGTPSMRGIGIGAMPTKQTRWQLRAVDTYAQMGAASNTMTTGSAVPAPPAAPTGLAGRVVNGDVLLTWDDRGAGHTYRVEVGGSVVATPSTAGVSLPAPALGESRDYTVTVVDGWGQTGPAATTTVTRQLRPPAAPTMLAAGRSLYGDVTVRWAEPADDDAGGITAYAVRVEREGTVVATRSLDGQTGSTTFGDLARGVPHTFTVTATNAFGAGPSSAPQEVIPVERPGSPVLGTVTPGDGSLLVRWSPPPSDGGATITRYEVRAVAAGSWAYAAAVDTGGDARSAVLPGLVNGTNHAVHVTAVNGAGFTASASTSAAPAAAPAVPSAPVLGQVSAGDSSAVVRWNAPPSDGGTALTGYTVRVFQGGAQVSSANAPAGATSATVTELTNGTAYTFAVAAVNAVGTGPDSARSAAVTPSVPKSVPLAPAITAVTPGDGSAVVSWNAPSSDGGSPITGYTVRAYSGGTLVRSAGASSGLRSLTVSGLINGTAYTFTVLAANAVGAGSPSAASAAVTPRPPAGPTVPSAPVLGQVSAGDASTVVRWTAPPSDGGAALTGYTVRVFRSGAQVSSANAPAGSSSTTVPGLTNGTAYTFAVAAVNAVGTGPDSARSAAVTPSAPATVPLAPAITAVTPGDGSAVVSWNAPSSDGGSPITGYTVRAYSGGTLVRSAGASSGLRSLTVSGLTNGTAHTFTVLATNAVGAGNPSAASAAVTPRPPATVPGAPAVVSATAADGSVDLAWAPPDSDGGSPVTGYVVDVWTYGSLSTSTTVPAEPTSTTIEGLANGVPHTFTVAATNAMGTGSSSAHSAEVTPAGPVVTVPAAPAIGTPSTYKATARVRWTAPADDGGAPVSGYEVRTYRGSTLVGTTTAAPGATSVAVAGLTLGQAHTFAVAAVNAVGMGPLSAPSAAVTPRTVPGAPKISSVSAARKAVVVKWVAPTSNGGGAITGWVVRAYSGGKAVTSTTVRADARAVAVTGLVAGRSYTFRVQAKNVVGGGSWSAASKAVKPQR